MRISALCFLFLAAFPLNAMAQTMGAAPPVAPASTALPPIDANQTGRVIVLPVGQLFPVCMDQEHFGKIADFRIADTSIVTSLDYDQHCVVISGREQGSSDLLIWSKDPLKISRYFLFHIHVVPQS